ncbi:MAG: ATP-binding protein [Chitinophagaceae bacterium]|nr:hypothetical protein [Chitinophagaceae bacterium]
MAVFILMIIFLHRKKQLIYQEKFIEIEANYEKNLLKSQLEIQEQTFQHISREIHDNISLSLTLAKLHLHTIEWKDNDKACEKVENSIELLSKSIAELSDLSKSLNADIIIQHGLLKAIEEEVQRIREAGLFSVSYEFAGTPVYMDSQKELIIFRIVQEAFNNIIKHAGASNAQLSIQYYLSKMVITISDDGSGFDTKLAVTNQKAGLKNMETRIKILKGDIQINSRPGNGTELSFIIPFE